MRIAGHTPFPQVEACVREFSADLQICAKVVQLVREKAEMPSRNLQRVDCFIGGWRFEPVEDESRVRLLDVERIAIMGNDDIGLVEEIPKLLD